MPAIQKTTTCVIVDGPFPDVDREGEEVATYATFLADDNGDEDGQVYHFRSYSAAIGWGRELKRQYPKLELVIEATRE